MRYLITTALIYANGPMHLGHLRSTYIPADIFARFLRLFGEEVVFISATDEHGTPISVAAEREGVSPKEFVDRFHERDRKEFERLGMSFDIFHRTSSKENYEMTWHFFKRMKENGYIYEKDIKQFYCPKCGRALSDRMVKGKCPYCGAEDQYGDQCEKCGRVLSAEVIVEPRCATCGTKPELKAYHHYFFALSKFSERLEEWIRNKKEFQEEVKNFVLNWIKAGLRDWDITRNLEWGIPVPGEEDLVFYVWFDAPIGYISSVVALTDEWEKYWKDPDTRIIHFIGKDIVYHHYLFWPAMLMATEDGFNLPYMIPVRGYLNLEGKKFSKSRGWYVTVEEFLERFPADYLRFYETMLTPYSTSDADFYWKDFQKRINNELVANIGNFIYRTLTLCKRTFGEEVPDGSIDEEMMKTVKERVEEIRKDVYECRIKEALDRVLELSSTFNAYLSEREPWKKKGEERKKILLTALYGAQVIITLMSPYTPFVMEGLMKELGIEGLITDRLTIKRIGEVRPPFRKVEDSVIKEMEERLRKSI